MLCYIIVVYRPRLWVCKDCKEHVFVKNMLAKSALQTHVDSDLAIWFLFTFRLIPSGVATANQLSLIRTGNTETPT